MKKLLLIAAALTLSTPMIDPKDSVVDGHCRTHDHENLFIASSSVFSTVGTGNITLTVAALALRVADTLKKELNHA